MTQARQPDKKSSASKPVPSLREVLAEGTPVRAARVVPRREPGLDLWAKAKQVARPPLFTPFALEGAASELESADMDRSRTLAVVLEAYSRDSEWFRASALDLAEVAVTSSLLKMGGADGLGEQIADAGLARVASAMRRFLTGKRADKVRGWNVLLLCVLVLGQRGLSLAAATRELAAARTLMGVDSDVSLSSVEALAVTRGPLQTVMVKSLAPLLASLAEAEGQLADLAVQEQAYRDALQAAADDVARLQAQLAGTEGELETARATVSSLESKIASMDLHAGHAIHTAKGEFGAFLNGPMSMLLADALTLADMGPDRLAAVREKLGDMEDEMRKAAG